MAEKETKRIHRVGSVTAGLCLIALGGACLVRLFTDALNFELIFSLWPLILIGIGAEILLSRAFEDRFVYDKGAIALCFISVLFAGGMAVCELVIRAAETHIVNF